MAGANNALAVLKRAVELCMPNLRHYYRVTRKARVTAAYASDGKYYADVQPLLNNDTPDPKEPIVPKVEIPIIWGGPERGLVCPPAVGTHCDLAYYDGDPNYPRISNFRWQGNGAPECGLTELVIQQRPGVSLKIDSGGNIITITPASIENEAGTDWLTKTGRNAALEAAARIDLKSPLVNIEGNQTNSGSGGAIGTATDKSHREHEGSYLLIGPMGVQGDAVFSGTVTAARFIGPVEGCAGCGG
jgi:hypothetical protein